MAAPRGLSADDIETLRTAVAAGRRPKVVFTSAAGQMAGQTGQVVDLGDPAGADEWISVRFGKDRLDFAPTDLQLPGKAPTRRATKAAASRATTTSTPAPAPTAREASPPPAPAPAAASVEQQPAPARGPRRGGRGKAPADLAVTVSWSDGDWTVAAQRGARTIVKPTPVSAADALRMVGMLQTPAVTDAVAEIVNAARAAAAERADQLRRELAEAEAKLAQFPELT
jgi:hypothetical protein